MIVYGPYERQDGRKHVVHYDSETGKRRTQSYPRYLMERFLDRPLESDEHVDHIDGDFTNNDIDNLQLLTQAENNRKAVVQLNRSAKWMSFVCPLCGKEFKLPAHRHRDNQIKQGKKGPYCSKVCAGMAK